MGFLADHAHVLIGCSSQAIFCPIVQVEFRSALWLYDGQGPWHFVTLPVELSEAVRDETAVRPTRFGSIPVVATIGTTTWSTSVFPERSLGALVLPVKAAVRQAETLAAGDIVTVRLEVAG